MTHSAWIFFIRLLRYGCTDSAPPWIPLPVYTAVAAAVHGLSLICSIKHIVNKRMCLLGVFQGSNYQAKYRRPI